MMFVSMNNIPFDEIFIGQKVYNDVPQFIGTIERKYSQGQHSGLALGLDVKIGDKVIYYSYSWKPSAVSHLYLEIDKTEHDIWIELERCLKQANIDW